MTHSTTIAPSGLDELCVNTLRFLAVDMVQKALTRLLTELGSPGRRPCVPSGIDSSR